MAMIDSPVIGAVAKYFDKRRSLGFGVTWTGVSVGTLTFPLLFKFLIDLYTIRGCMLILGGMFFHGTVCGALLRPDVPSRQYLNKDNLKEDITTETVPNISILYVIKNSKIIVLTSVFFLGFCGAHGQLFLIPLISKEKGFDKLYASTLLTVSGVMELCARFPVGCLGDRLGMDKSFIFGVLHCVLGVATFIVRSVCDKNTMTLLSVLLGCFGTAFTTLIGPLYADAVGPQYGATTTGIGFFAWGISYAIFPPLVGKYWDSNYCIKEIHLVTI